MRIVVVGTSGSGKTTMAARLSQALALPFVELDAINWQPGWRDLATHDPDEFLRRTDEATAAPAWVADGNYRLVRPLVWSRATHLVWLDYDRGVIMRRVIARSLMRALDGKELWGGNREDWRRWLDREHPIRWAWDTWARRRREYEAMLDEPGHAHLKVLRLRRPREAGSVMQRLVDDARPTRSTV
jgi:adenylate kinase family enzyme